MPGGQSADGHRPWERTWRLKVQDPRFFNGKFPVVDIDLTYHLPSWGSVEVYAAAADGKVRHVGGGWGNTHDWKTIHLQLDDACFGKSEKNAEGLGPFDLRITGSNAPLYLQKVRLTFYDPQKDVHWDRMLKVEDFAAETPGGVLAFGRKAAALKLNLHNLAFVDRPVKYRLELQDLSGKGLFTAQENVTVPAKSSVPIRLPFDASSWALGPYRGQFDVLADDKPAVSMPLRLGVISDTTLDKSRNDEFFFGLDVANNSIYRTDTDAGAAYYRLMGVDFLRDLPLFGGPTPEKIRTAIDFLQREQLRSCFMIGPPNPLRKDAPVDAKELDRRADILAGVVSKYGGRAPGHVFMVELGNEPDLPAFWPADVRLYADAMNILSDRARAARDAASLKPGDFLVANGGLSFAGVTGAERSRQLLALFDPSKLDVIAYHGHGPGIIAERTAFERLRDARAQTSARGLPAVETESGFSASSDAGLMEQSRTAVEKMVYGQSVHLPALVFFRLFMAGSGNEGGYGMTEHFIQPRPSVLSYRNVVERLRHRRFERTLDATAIAGVKGVDLFLFAETQPDGQPTGRKTIVAFSETAAQPELIVRLDDPAAAVRDVALYDIFGNAMPISVMPGNIVRLPVSQNAVYLEWTSPGKFEATALIPPMLALQMPDPLLQGADTAAVLVVRNPGMQSMKAEVNIEATASVSIGVQPIKQTLDVPASGQVVLPITFHVGTAASPLQLPKWWRIYPDADPAQLEGHSWKTLPADLKKLGGGSVAGQQMFAPDNRLEFTKPFGNPGEHRPAIGLAYIDCPHDTTLPAAARANWWVNWYVNGQVVPSNQAAGGGMLADHPFDLPLKAGRNVIAFNCGSGSQGWSIEFGGPRERQQAVSGAQPLDRAHIELKADGHTLADLVAPLELAEAVQPSGEISNPSMRSQWMPLEPLAVLGPDRVQNLFYKEPDSKRWYQGPGDLSAVVWLRDDVAGGKLHIAVAVKDDKHVPAAEGEPLDAHDSLRCTFADESGKMLADIVLAAPNRQTTVNPAIETTATREEAAADGPTTFYHLAIPRALLPASPMRLGLRVADDDGFGLKQTMELGDVANPAAGIRCRLAH